MEQARPAGGYRTAVSEPAAGRVGGRRRRPRYRARRGGGGVRAAGCGARATPAPSARGSPGGRPALPLVPAAAWSWGSGREAGEAISPRPVQGNSRAPPTLTLAPWCPRSLMGTGGEHRSTGVEIRKDMGGPFAMPSLFISQMGRLRLRVK